jgi:hypothetical protein
MTVEQHTPTEPGRDAAGSGPAGPPAGAAPGKVSQHRKLAYALLALLPLSVLLVYLVVQAMAASAAAATGGCGGG